MKKTEVFNLTRTVPLVLSTSAISQPRYAWDTTTDNSVGTLAKFRTEMTFKNINLETLLGDLYYKYDEFSIQLAQVFSLTDVAAGVSLDASLVTIHSNLCVYMSGFDFCNDSTYNQKNGNNRNYIHMTNLSNQVTTLDNSMTQNAVLYTRYEYFTLDMFSYASKKIKFRKQKTLNINLWIGSSKNEHILKEDIPTLVGGQPWTGTTLPHLLFKFNITPVI